MRKTETERKEKSGANPPSIRRIIHIIANGVHARRTGTAVLADRAARRALALLGRVVDVVARVVHGAGVVLLFIPINQFSSVQVKFPMDGHIHRMYIFFSFSFFPFPRSIGTASLR